MMKQSTKDRILEMLKTVLVSLNLVPILEIIVKRDTTPFLIVLGGILITLVLYVLYTVIISKLLEIFQRKYMFRYLKRISANQHR